MKTSEFIKRVEELGYGAVDYDGCTEIHRNSIVYAKVLKNEVNQLDTSYYVNVSDDLFNVLVEYANTPIEKRKDSKKYCLYNPVKDSYFNHWFATKEYCWGNSTQMDYLQTQFTEDEIKENKFRDIMELLVREEV